jgi:putative membrane protein
MASFLKRWLILALAVALTASILPGIHATSMGLIAATLLLSILNAFVRPALVVLVLPLLVLSLGLLLLVINALLLWWVGSIVKGFHVDSFMTAFWASLVISLISLLLNSLTGSGDSRIKVRRRSQAARPPSDQGGGPIIDV